MRDSSTGQASGHPKAFQGYQARGGGEGGRHSRSPPCPSRRPLRKRRLATGQPRPSTPSVTWRKPHDSGKKRVGRHSEMPPEGNPSPPPTRKSDTCPCKVHPFRGTRGAVSRLRQEERGSPAARSTAATTRRKKKMKSNKKKRHRCVCSRAYPLLHALPARRPPSVARG